MKKVILPIISIVALLLLFGLTYAVVKSLEHPQSEPSQTAPTGTQGFSQDQQTVGQVGGVHYLETGALTDDQDFQRLTLSTKLNRSSTLDDTIATPYTTGHIVADGQPYIDLELSDTTTLDTQEVPPVNVYSGINGPAKPENTPVTKVSILPSTEGGQEIRIYLTDSSKSFRLQTDPQNPSNVWVDILK